MAFSLNEFMKKVLPDLQPQTAQQENYTLTLKIDALKTKQEALAMISSLTAMSTLGHRSSQNEKLLGDAKKKAKLLGAEDAEIIKCENSAMQSPRL